MAAQEPTRAKQEEPKPKEQQGASPARATASVGMAPPPSGPTLQRAAARPGSLTGPEVLQMQRAVGNQATRGLLRGPRGAVAQDPPASSPIQRAADTGSSEGPLSTPTAPAPANATGIPDGLLRRMESGFGADFSGVQIHADSSRAPEVGALAFTQGEHIHFAPSRYQPETLEGQRLLGHELAHVVQQREGRVRSSFQAYGADINDDDGLEREADLKADQVLRASIPEGSGGGIDPHPARPSSTGATRGAHAPLQRKVGFEFQVKRSKNPGTRFYKDGQVNTEPRKGKMHQGDGWHLESDGGDPEAVTEAQDETKEGFDRTAVIMADIARTFREWEQAEAQVPLNVEEEFSIKVTKDQPIRAAPQATGGLGFAALYRMMDRIYNKKEPLLQYRTEGRDDLRMMAITRKALRQASAPENLTDAVRGVLALMATYVFGGQVATNGPDKGKNNSLYYAKNATPFMMRNTFQAAVKTLSEEEQERLRDLLNDQEFLKNFFRMELGDRIFPKGLADMNDPKQGPVKDITLQEFIQEVKSGLQEVEDEDEAPAHPMFDYITRSEEPDLYPTNLGPRGDINTPTQQLEEADQQEKLGVVIEFRRLGPSEVELTRQRDGWAAFALNFFRALNAVKGNERAVEEEEEEEEEEQQQNLDEFRGHPEWATLLEAAKFGQDYVRQRMDIATRYYQVQFPNGMLEEVMRAHNGQ